MTTRTLGLLALLVGTACAANQPATRTPGWQSRSFAEATPVAAIEASEWWTAETPCPDGAELKGALPPRGNAVWCQQGGQVHGTKTTVHMNGRSRRSERFCRGRLEGYFAVWHENGVIAEEGRFHNGLLEGQWTRHHVNGAREAE